MGKYIPVSEQWELHGFEFGFQQDISLHCTYTIPSDTNLSFLSDKDDFFFAKMPHIVSMLFQKTEF